MFPVIFGAAGQIPPATLYYLWQYVIVGLIFNYLLRRLFLGWWTHYNYTLSGALDIGTALCTVVVGLVLGLGNAEFPSWWGNTVSYDTMDFFKNATTKTFDRAGGQTPLGPSSW